MRRKGTAVRFPPRSRPRRTVREVRARYSPLAPCLQPNSDSRPRATSLPWVLRQEQRQQEVLGVLLSADRTPSLEGNAYRVDPALGTDLRPVVSVVVIRRVTP